MPFVQNCIHREDLTGNARGRIEIARCFGNGYFVATCNRIDPQGRRFAREFLDGRQPPYGMGMVCALKEHCQIFPLLQRIACSGDKAVVEERRCIERLGRQALCMQEP